MAENMFIGQSVLLEWLNGTLNLKLEKIEDVRLEVVDGLWLLVTVPMVSVW